MQNSVDDTVQMKSAIQEFRRIGERMISISEKLMPNPKEEEKASEKDEKDVKKEKDEKKFPKKVIFQQESQQIWLNTLENFLLSDVSR